MAGGGQNWAGEEPVTARVHVTLPLGVSLPGMPTQMQCEGATVAEALADCVAQEPRLRGRIFSQEGVPRVGVTVNGASLPQEAGLASAVQDGDQIRLMPAVGAC